MTRQTVVMTNVTDYAGPPAAATLAREGMNVLCHSPAFADARIRSAYEAEHRGQTAALAQSPDALVAEALERFGRLDAAVSNDLGDVMRGDFTERTADDFRELLERFAVAPVRLALAALPHMKERRRGRLLFITSGSPMSPAKGLSMYAASRAAPNTLVKALAKEFGPFGISINAVAPYFLESNAFPLGMKDPAFAEYVRQSVPMQRMGTPDEVGALIALLVSGRSDFISGQIIAFSGGGA